MKNKLLILETIKNFLKNKDWLLKSKNERYLRYSAPDELGFSEPYVLYVPNNIKFIDFIDSTNRTVHFLSEVYEIQESDIIQ